MLTGVLYEGHSISLWAIDAAYVVIGLVILGAIHGAWKKVAKAPAA